MHRPLKKEVACGNPHCRRAGKLHWNLDEARACVTEVVTKGPQTYVGMDLGWGDGSLRTFEEPNLEATEAFRAEVQERCDLHPMGKHRYPAGKTTCYCGLTYGTRRKLRP